jgi:hypothetical protein
MSLATFRAFRAVEADPADFEKNIELLILHGSDRGRVSIEAPTPMTANKL